jgi:hypothetical protein
MVTNIRHPWRIGGTHWGGNGKENAHRKWAFRPDLGAAGRAGPLEGRGYSEALQAGLPSAVIIAAIMNSPEYGSSL